MFGSDSREIKRLREKVETLEKKVSKLIDDTAIYSTVETEVMQFLHCSIPVPKKYQLNKVVQAIIDHLGIVFKSTPAKNEGIEIVKKK